MKRTFAGCLAGALMSVAWSLTGTHAPAADWDIALSDQTTFTIRHQGDPVVTSSYVFWGANWKFAGARLAITQREGGQATFSGAVRDLGLTLTGRISQSTPQVLKFDYQIEAVRDLAVITGGGLEFNLKLNSSSFAAAPPSPELLPNDAGWKWPVGGGREVAVSFSPSPASVYFERGNKGKIRAMLIGSQLKAGKHAFAMTVQLPTGGQLVKSPTERYGPTDTSGWFRGALRHDVAPVDARFLNADDRPAGRRGFLRAEGDQLLFADDTPARFWGGNLAAYALFADKKQIEQQARRIAALGFNLMRLHHHDSMRWVNPTVIDKSRNDSRQFNAEALDRIDWWIRCLKNEGVYVWLDLHVGRQFKPGDGITEGFEEITRKDGEGKGFCYFNPKVRELMQEFQAAYLNHVNRYTGLAYKDDPAVMGLLLTNENDLTHHFGNLMLADKGNPVHHALFKQALQQFAAQTGLPAAQLERTWEGGPSKIFLNDVEHRFNQAMLQQLASLHVRVPIATTSYWGNDGLHALPALAAGSIIDAHSYGQEEALSVNPRHGANFIAWIGTAQVHDKPLAITEWNVEYPATDRFTAPLYLASIAALQGWDAPMIYNYSQRAFDTPTRTDKWSTYFDPALAGLMPAAAIVFRQGHVSPARTTYCLQLTREQLYYAALDPAKSAALRTLVEQSRLTLGLPDIKELDWDRPTQPAPGVKVVTDPQRDFIPAGQHFVRSDTGELTRDWEQGWQTIDTPKTQAAAGWIGGQSLQLKDVTMNVATPKATVAVTSLDNEPVVHSHRLLLTLMARVLPGSGEKMPFLSEPVRGTLTLRSQVEGLKLVPLGPDGQELPAVALSRQGDRYTLKLPPERGTHWFILK